MKATELKNMPSNWNMVTMEQFRILGKLKARYPSEETYLTYCFMYFQDLIPMLYVSRWKEILSHIPVIRRFIQADAMRIETLESDYLGIAEPFAIWSQCYRFKGVRNFLFGKRFWMQDQEVLSFMNSLKFLTTPIRLNINPIPYKKIKKVTYKSYHTQLADMPWIDYNNCCRLAEKYASTQKKEFLYAFVSCMYEIDNVEKVKRYFSELELRLIMLFWSGCQENFRVCFPNLFSGKGKSSITKDYLKEEAEITVFLSKQAFATPDTVRKGRAYDALEYLQQNAKDVEDRKREMEKMRNK